jgi:hypothetical protein
MDSATILEKVRAAKDSYQNTLLYSGKGSNGKDISYRSELLGKEGYKALDGILVEPVHNLLEKMKTSGKKDPRALNWSLGAMYGAMGALIEEGLLNLDVEPVSVALDALFDAYRSVGLGEDGSAMAAIFTVPILITGLYSNRGPIAKTVDKPVARLHEELRKKYESLPKEE